jgi:hypothetical protein
MNFLYGILTLAIAIWALSTTMKAAAGLWRCAVRLIRISRKHGRLHSSPVPVVREEPNIPVASTAPDWQALSRDLRRNILARGVRVSGENRKLCQLDQAIEIEKREIELARLKAEKLEIRARNKFVRCTDRSDRHRRPTSPSVAPIDQIKALREATRIGSSSLSRPSSGIAATSRSKRQTSDSSIPLPH